jgi:hypothetical protein
MIVGFYSQIEPPKHVNCLVCGHIIALAHATTLTDNYFAHANHLAKGNELRWLRGWCRFIVRKRIAITFAFVTKNMVVFA